MHHTIPRNPRTQNTCKIVTRTCKFLQIQSLEHQPPLPSSRKQTQTVVEITKWRNMETRLIAYVAVAASSQTIEPTTVCWPSPPPKPSPQQQERPASTAGLIHCDPNDSLFPEWTSEHICLQANSTYLLSSIATCHRPQVKLHKKITILLKLCLLQSKYLSFYTKEFTYTSHFASSFDLTARKLTTCGLWRFDHYRPKQRLLQLIS